MQLTIKRLLDIIMAAALLLLLSPLLFVISCVIWRSLGRPVFFKQIRIGKDEKPFLLVKFRTMVMGQGDDAARLSQLGVRLRATSLDELPELWNILRGQMSFVGPRPLLPEYLPFYKESERSRHLMRPGITGLAQVSGRNAISWEQRLCLDAEYVNRWNLLLDMRILLLTVITVLKRQGISAEGHATMPRLDDERKRSGA